MASAFDVILGLAPVIKAAAETVEAFRGGEAAARTDSTILNALHVIEATAPILGTFARGGNVTQEDARDALAGYDQAIDDLDAEIARQKGQQPAP